MKKKRKSKLITTKLDAGNVELNTAFFNNAMNVGGCGLAENQQLNEYNYDKNGLEIQNGELVKYIKAATSITIPDSVTSIGDCAFYRCNSLTTIIIPNSVKSIGYNAFHGCSKLTSITIPDSVTIIRSSAFNGCSNLTSIKLPNSLTSISDLIFNNCSSLTNIEIPNSVKSIGSGAFSNCNRLKDVYYAGSRLDWAEIEIGEYNDDLLAADIHFLNDKYSWLDDMVLDEKLSINDWNYIDIIDKFIEDIYDLRKQSIKNEGEYSVGNLVFKEFRNLGYLDKLKDMKNKLKSKELSLESIQESSGELEESLDSWYDKRNKSWANFYRQKAGVAAGDAIDTDNLDPWAVSITCCYKNCSPELLKEVLKTY